jgi:predicted AlkP superfamily pyrophosphatase or phosphodiesterase
MALATANELGMGSAGHTDLLAISFSALDLVGHIYGPNSHEVQDVLVRLDRSIGDLLDGLDRLVGAGNYVVALSADHGVAPTPERGRIFGLDAARVPARAITDAAQKAIAAELGPGRYVNRLMSSDLYLAEGVLDRLRARPGAIARVRDAIAAVPGVQAVYAGDDLTLERQGVDPLARELAASFVPSRSGDMLVVLKPYWLLGGAGGTSHGTLWEYDTHVPLLLAGAGISAGNYLTPVSPLDIAPTLAYLTGITLPNAKGHILADAVRNEAPSSGNGMSAPAIDRTR